LLVYSSGFQKESQQEIENWFAAAACLKVTDEAAELVLRAYMA
jgi:hypothetical protein